MEGLQIYDRCILGIGETYFGLRNSDLKYNSTHWIDGIHLEILNNSISQMPV